MNTKTATLVILFGSVFAHAGTMLNQVNITANYRNGDFDSIEKEIREFQTKNKTCPRADSIFITKHLAVIYASNPATREKGKYYMHAMLNLNVGAKLTDMFVGEGIQKLFDGVRDEFIAARESAGRPLSKSELAEFEGVNRNGSKTSISNSNEVRAEGSGQKKAGNLEVEKSSGVWWAVGGVAAAAVIGATTYVLVTGQDGKKEAAGPNVTAPDGGGGL